MWKIYILFVCFSLALAEKTFIEKLHEAERKCEGIHHVTRKQMDDLRSEIDGDTDKIDRKYKCFVKCVLDEININAESGKIDLKQVARIYNRTDDTLTKLVVADCAAKHDSETDDCERKFKTIVCVVLNYKKST